VTRMDAADEARSDALATARLERLHQKDLLEVRKEEVRKEEMRARVSSGNLVVPVGTSVRRATHNRPASTRRASSASHPRSSTVEIGASSRTGGTNVPENPDQRRARRRFEMQQVAMMLRVKMLQNSGVGGGSSRRWDDEAFKDVQTVRGSMLDKLIKGDSEGARQELENYEKLGARRERRQHEEAANMTGRVTWVAPKASEWLRGASYADPTRASLSREAGVRVRAQSARPWSRAAPATDLRMAPSSALAVSRRMSHDVPSTRRSRSPEHFRDVRGLRDEDQIAQQLRVRRGSQSPAKVRRARSPSSLGGEGVEWNPTTSLNTVSNNDSGRVISLGRSSGDGSLGEATIGQTRLQAEAFDHSAANDRNHASELLRVLYSNGFRFFAGLLAATGLGEELGAVGRPQLSGLKVSSVHTRRFIIFAPFDEEISGRFESNGRLGRAIRRFGLEGILSDKDKPWPEVARYISILRNGYNLHPDNPDVVQTYEELCQHIWDVGVGSEGNFESVSEVLKKTEAASSQRLGSGEHAALQGVTPDRIFSRRESEIEPQKVIRKGPSKGDMKAALSTLKMAKPKARLSEVNIVTFSTRTTVPLLLDPDSLPIQRPADVAGDRPPLICVPSDWERSAEEWPELACLKHQGGVLIDIVPCKGLTHAPFSERVDTAT